MSKPNVENGSFRSSAENVPRDRFGRAQIFLADNRRSAAVLLVGILIAFVTAAAIGLHQWASNERSTRTAEVVDRAQSAASQLESTFAAATPSLGASISRALADDVPLREIGVEGRAWALDRRGHVIDSAGGGRLGFPLEARAAVNAGTLAVSDLIGENGAHPAIRIGIPLANGGRTAAVVATVPAAFMSRFVGSAVDTTTLIGSGRAALLDPQGRTLVSDGINRAQGEALTRALRSAPSGTIELDGTTQLYASDRVSGSPWSVVLAARKDQVLASAGGPAGWLGWAVLFEFAVAALLGIVLLMRVLRDADRVAGQNVQLSERSVVAEQATQAKSGFISTIAHEMRTPLAAISMFAEAMRADSEEPLSPAQRRRATEIVAGTRHVLDLLDDTSDIERVEAGRLDLKPERLSIAATAIGVVDVMAPLAADRAIELTLEADGRLGEVFLDASRVRQVMINFLSNALKFTPSGGSVTMRIEPRGGETFAIAVSDTGVGVPEGVADRLFAPGAPVSVPVHEGDATSGLGLTVTRRLAEAMGGRVGVESVEGRGSTFFAILPRISSERRNGFGRPSGVGADRSLQ